MKTRVALTIALASVLLLAFTAGSIFSSSSKLGGTDPDRGLTPDEQLAAQEANSAAFWARYEDWIVEQNALNVDPRDYPVHGALVSVAAPAPTLNEAVRQAEFAVEGTVASVEFRSTADSVVTVAVSQQFKGRRVGETIAVVLPNTLLPTEDWGEPMIAEVESMPMVYPGDVVSLLLVKDPNYAGSYGVQSWTGTYWHRGGHVDAVHGNPFAGTVEKFTTNRFRDALSAAAD